MILYDIMTLHPCLQTLHCSHDISNSPQRITSIFNRQIDMGERVAGKQDGFSIIIMAPKDGHIVISVSVRSSVRSSQIIFADG